MSFSFNAAGSPKEVIAEVGKQAANLDQVPNGFADSINDQLGRLPEDAEVTLVCHGHTGWEKGQTTGQISMHATLDVRAAPAAQKPEGAPSPEVQPPQPGPERFPDDFEGDAPPGPPAGVKSDDAA